MKKLEYATIAWDNDLPSSIQYQDIYHSRETFAQSKHIFLGLNDLAERFSLAKDTFVIAETGFGFGFNFLYATSLFLKHAHSPSAHLHYISCDIAPTSPKDLQRFWSKISAFDKELVKKLLDFYPAPHIGWIRIAFTPNVTLSLYWGEGASAISDIAATSIVVNAWFLDGFSPSKNPELWTFDLIADIARCCGKDSTLATFTVARSVINNLTNNQFEVEKHICPVTHKQITKGIYTQNKIARSLQDQSKSIGIIGAGLAGSTLAKALSKRHRDNITIVDSSLETPPTSFNNPFALFHPKYPAPTSHFAHFAHLAYHYSSSWLPLLPYFKATGVTHIFNEKQSIQLSKAYNYWRPMYPNLLEKTHSPVLSPHHSEECAYYPQAGWIDCQKLSNHFTESTCYLKRTVHSIKHIDNCWHIFDEDGRLIHAFDILIVAAGHGSEQILKNIAPLSFTKTAGSVHRVSLPPLFETKTFTYSGSFIPMSDNSWVVGSSYEHPSSPESQKNNLLRASIAIKALTNVKVSVEGEKVFSSFRCGTRDRMPCIGEVKKNLYVSSGFGSHGLAYSPIASEIIADIIMDENLLFPSVAPIINPLRLAAESLTVR